MAVTAPHLLPFQADPEAVVELDPDDRPESSDSEAAALKNILVMIYTHSGPVQQRTMWIDPTEAHDALMRRANILFCNDQDYFVILPADPQPPQPHFALILVPRWWTEARILPLFCILPMPPCLSFLHTAVGAEGLEDMLPSGIFDEGRGLDVYVPPAVPGAPAVEPSLLRPAYDLQPGALVLFQNRNDPQPDLPSVASHLQTLPHVRSSDFPETTFFAPHPCDVAILGVAYEQFVLRLTAGGFREQIARHLGMPVQDTYVIRQPVGFERPVVLGQPVSACFGVRSISVNGDPPLGRAVFIDPRTIGRSFVYRTVLNRRLCPEDVCSMLGIPVPEGYQAYCEGGVRCPRDPLYFLVDHAMNITVWLDSQAPASSPSARSEASTPHCDGDDVTETPPSDEPPTEHQGRSRSPRWRASSDTAGPGHSPSESFAAPTDAESGCVSDDLLKPILQPLGSGAPACRPLPTPCRARPRTSQAAHIDPLSAQPCTGPFQTLLDCAGLHLAQPFLENVLNFLSVSSAAPPALLCLDKALVPCADQQLVLDLQCLLGDRGVAQVPVPEDWLDADLQSVLRVTAAPVDVRVRLHSVKSWWDLPSQKDLRRIHIYTDGSFQQRPGTATQPCSWAFAVWMQGESEQWYYGHSAHCAVPANTPYHLGENRDDALVGELLALAWAFIWILDQGVKFAVPITIFYDSTSAGGGSFSLVQQSQDAGHKVPSLPAFVTDLRLCAVAQVEITPGHVRSHTGVLGNEVADVLARHAAQQWENCYQRCLPSWPARLAAHPLRAWAWKLFDTAPDLPTLYAFPSEARRLQQSCQPVAPPPKRGQRTSTVYGQLTLDFRSLTLNVLTLLDPAAKTTVSASSAPSAVGMRIMGKRDILKRQLLAHNIAFAGLQETRLSVSQELPDRDFWMLHASCTPAGQLGTALWIRKGISLGTFAGKPCVLEHGQFTVVVAQPRLLVVSMSAPFLNLIIVVAHAPFDGSPSLSPAEFWREVAGHLDSVPPATPLLILTDANAHVGSCQTHAIGSVHPDEENPAGEAWHQFLLGHSLAALNTHEECHSGPSETWISPHGKARRLDFIAAPCEWKAAASTWVAADFELLQHRDDHLPVVACLRLYRPCYKGAFLQPPERRAMRPSAGWSADQRQTFVATLSCQPNINWAVPVDAHYDCWADQYQQVWQDVCTAAPAAPQQPYLQQDTLSLVQERSAYRVYIRQETQELRRRRLLMVFAAFLLHARHRAFDDLRLQTLHLWFWQMHVSVARAMLFLVRTGSHVRHAVRRDRRQYLDNIKQDVACQDIKNSKELFAALRRAFPCTRSARRGGLKPLPQLLMADGSPAVTREERMQRWRSFFAEQEAGFEVTDDQYVLELSAQKQLQADRASVFDWQIVPTLRETEALIHQQRKGKACGNDGVTPELLRLDVAGAARRFLPVMAKTVLRVHEPSAFRGGSLMTLAKKVAAECQCSHYRSILLACAPSKIYHRYVRQQLVPILQKVSPPLQAGAVPGLGVESLSLLARLLQDLFAKSRCC